MSMQLCCVNPQPQQDLPPSDIDILKAELMKIEKFRQDINAGTAIVVTYEGLKAAVLVINEIILSLDNSNDFFKIGGFNQLMPLLECSDGDVVAATAELVADLCQNNTFCQTKALQLNILPELVKLLNNHSDLNVRSKALYALSCLCRSNTHSLEHLESTNISPVLIKILEESDEKLRAKTAFFMTYLSSFSSFRDTFYEADVIGILIKLVEERHNSSTEQLLSALRFQIERHLQSRVQCREEKYDLKKILLDKMRTYSTGGEYDEAREHCEKILSLCFPEKNNV